MNNCPCYHVEGLSWEQKPIQVANCQLPKVEPSSHQCSVASHERTWPSTQHLHFGSCGRARLGLSFSCNPLEPEQGARHFQPSQEVALILVSLGRHQQPRFYLKAVCAGFATQPKQGQCLSKSGSRLADQCPHIFSSAVNHNIQKTTDISGDSHMNAGWSKWATIGTLQVSTPTIKPAMYIYFIVFLQHSLCSSAQTGKCGKCLSSPKS